MSSVIQQHYHRDLRQSKFDSTSIAGYEMNTLADAPHTNTACTFAPRISGLHKQQQKKQQRKD
jgi:hypothetical protein